MAIPSSFRPLTRVDAPDGSRRPYLMDPETGEGHYVTNVVTDANDDITGDDFKFAPPRPKRVEATAWLDDYEPSEEDWADLANSDPDEPVQAAAGMDVTPGRERLHHYWTRGKGLARWRGSAHPWTTLVSLLSEHVSIGKAKRFASKWFKEVFGYWPGHRKGKNPVGPG